MFPSLSNHFNNKGKGRPPAGMEGPNEGLESEAAGETTLRNPRKSCYRGKERTGIPRESCGVNSSLLTGPERSLEPGDAEDDGCIEFGKPITTCGVAKHLR